MNKSLVVAFSLVLAFFLIGCTRQGTDSTGGGSESNQLFDSSLPSGVISLEVSPMADGSYKYIVPLGNLNPSDHTLPTDHVYFTHDDATETIPVYAPVGGKILDIYTFTYGSEHDNRVVVGVKSTYSYYLIHLVISSSLKVGDTVQTGQQMGVASKHAAAVDLGVLNKNSSQPFINSTHYVDMNIYSDAPLKYYIEPVKSQLYANVRRLGSDKDGKFCYDQPGKLVGGWFLSDVATADITAGTAVGTKEIAFVYDNYDPNQIMISVGGTVFSKGVYYVQNGAADPVNVTAASGKIPYKLYLGSSETSRTGLMIVEMTADDKVKIEGFNDTSSDTADFTPAASPYIR
ncbi:MAG: hypothetical protein WC624_03120 [Candidatus Margulisiibacteriota bacterium]